MKYDYQTALNIAYAGFDKMRTQASEGKYTVYALSNNRFEIHKSNGEVYNVAVYTNNVETGVPVGDCDCPFCDFGRENHVCKHILFCEDLVSAAAMYREDSEDFASAINDAQEKALEDARYDALADEWLTQQAYYRYGSDAVV